MDPKSIIKIVPQEQCEEAHFYVCSPASITAVFDDDLFANCCECGQRVRHRPSGPTKPKKICSDCALSMFTDEDKHIATEAQIAELKRKIQDS